MCFQINSQQNILDITNIPDILFKKVKKTVTKEFLFNNSFISLTLMKSIASWHESSKARKTIVSVKLLDYSLQRAW